MMLFDVLQISFDIIGFSLLTWCGVFESDGWDRCPGAWHGLPRIYYLRRGLIHIIFNWMENVFIIEIKHQETVCLSFNSSLFLLWYVSLEKVDGVLWCWGSYFLGWLANILSDCNSMFLWSYVFSSLSLLIVSLNIVLWFKKIALYSFKLVVNF